MLSMLRRQLPRGYRPDGHQALPGSWQALHKLAGGLEQPKRIV